MKARREKRMERRDKSEGRGKGKENFEERTIIKEKVAEIKKKLE